MSRPGRAAAPAREIASGPVAVGRVASAFVSAMAVWGVLALSACAGDGGATPGERGSVGLLADEAAPEAVATTAHFPAPGSRPPDFHLPELLLEAPWVGDDSLRLSDLRGRYVYLDVFGSWCLPCRQRHPEMLRVAAALEAEGAQVVGLLLEDRPETAARWLAEHGATYPFLVVDDRTARAWGLTGAPMGFLTSPEGRVVRACHGCAHGEHAIEGLPAEVARLRSRP